MQREAKRTRSGGPSGERPPLDFLKLWVVWVRRASLISWAMFSNSSSSRALSAAKPVVADSHYYMMLFVFESADWRNSRRSMDSVGAMMVVMRIARMMPMAMSMSQ